MTAMETTTPNIDQIIREITDSKRLLDEVIRSINDQQLKFRELDQKIYSQERESEYRYNTFVAWKEKQEPVIQQINHLANNLNALTVNIEILKKGFDKVEQHDAQYLSVVKQMTQFEVQLDVLKDKFNQLHETYEETYEDIQNELRSHTDELKQHKIFLEKLDASKKTLLLIAAGAAGAVALANGLRELIIALMGK